MQGLLGTPAFAPANNELFTNIANKICLSLTDQTDYTANISKFYVSESEINGDGVETTVWPDFIPKKMDNKTCCLSECGECIVQPLSKILPNNDWNRICGTFSEDQLKTAFCRGSDVITKLANGMIVGMNNARLEHMDKTAVTLLNDINNFWIDGEKGQQISSSNTIEDVYGIILELRQGTNRFNSIKKRWQTPITGITVIGNAKAYKQFASELTSKCQPLFSNCTKPIDCNQLSFLIMPIEDGKVIVIDNRWLKAWEIFVRMKSREDESCLRTNYYLHYKYGVAVDDYYNAVTINYNTGDDVDNQKNADEIKKIISEITGADLNISANDETTAKPLIQAVIDGKVTDKKGLELVYVYSDFKAPIDAGTDGSYKVRVDIKKGSTIFATQEKTFVLKFKSLSPEQLSAFIQPFATENKELIKKVEQLQKELKKLKNGVDKQETSDKI